MNTMQPTLLLAEDDDNDIFFMRRALRKADVNFPLQVVTNGQEALDYLGGNGKFAVRENYPLPALIFLDLKMPFIDGFDVLAWIRSNPLLDHVPVVVLTSSPEERDRQKAAELGARAYFVKPPTPESIKAMMNFLASHNERMTVPEHASSIPLRV
jgi:CheY-like chemotaxis protein